MKQKSIKNIRKEFKDNGVFYTPPELAKRMCNLKLRGVPVMVEGVERHFLFTLNVIDEIQNHYNLDFQK